MPEHAATYQHHPDLKRLLKAINRAGNEFALFFVECNLSSLRNKLADALASDLSPSPVRVDLSILAGNTQQLDELIAKQVQDTLAPVFLFGLEQWLPTLSDDQLRSTVQQLNWRRNRFARLQRPLIIWLPRYALDILAEHTPDFYDWYSGVFVFHASTELQAQAEGNSLQALWSDSGVHAAARLSLEEKKRWLHTLRELLQEHTQVDAGQAPLLGNLARILMSLGDYKQAQTYLQQALAIQQQIGDKFGEGATLNNMATIAHARSDYVTALNYLQKSLVICQKIGEKSGEGVTLNNMAQIYKARGDFATAQEYLKKSLVIRQEIGDKSGEGTTLNNMATIAHARGDYATALDHLEKSLVIWQEIGDKSGVGATLNNISQIYKVRGDNASALDYLEKSLVICQEIGNKSGVGVALNNISKIYDARGDNATALDYLEKSLVIRQEIGDMAGLCATLFNMGLIHLRNAERDKAMQTWLKVYRIAKQINLAQALDELTMLAEQLNLPGGLAGWEALAQKMKTQDTQALTKSDVLT
jgi:tetratricopeptide (TPR) repeat protein